MNTHKDKEARVNPLDKNMLGIPGLTTFIIKISPSD